MLEVNFWIQLLWYAAFVVSVWSIAKTILTDPERKEENTHVHSPADRADCSL